MKPDLDRLRDLMAGHGFDAIAALDFENFYYLAGAVSIFMIGQQPTGMGMALIPADPKLEPALVVNDMEGRFFDARTWVEDIRSFPTWMSMTEQDAMEAAPETRPCLLDYDTNFRLMAEVVRERGLEGGRIGVTVSAFEAEPLRRLRELLPKAELVDAAGLLYAMRCIKREDEIALLRKAAQVAEAAMHDAASLIREGVTQAELVNRLKHFIIDHPDADNYKFVGAAVGPNAITPSASAKTATARQGDIVKIDSGAECGGYISDMGRTYVVGKAPPAVQRLYDSIRRAHDAAEAKLRPGVPIKDVYAAGMAEMRGGALPSYSRGHLGHSIGIGLFPEEPPYIAPNEERALEPGMVLCMEVPVYLFGVGALHIENTYVIIEDGHENFIESEKDLVSR
jgi:Xaa-Pro aminopeptidase